MRAKLFSPHILEWCRKYSGRIKNFSSRSLVYVLKRKCRDIVQYGSRDKFLSGVVGERTTSESRAKVAVNHERIAGETKRFSRVSPVSPA